MMRIFVNSKYFAIVLAVSGACGAQSGKLMTDLNGDVVAVWDGPAGEETVVNERTGYLADGGDIAKRTRPGLMYLIDADLALIRELNGQGQALAEGAGSLVANHEVINGDDESLFNGESLSTTAVITSGVVKNPGPEMVQVQVTSDGQVETLFIHPGDGLYIGEPDEDLFEQLGISVQCICTCTSDTHPVKIRAIALPCIYDPEEETFDPFEECECEPWNDGACIVDDRQGTLSNCRPGVAS